MRRNGHGYRETTTPSGQVTRTITAADKTFEYPADAPTPTPQQITRRTPKRHEIERLASTQGQSPNDVAEIADLLLAGVDTTTINRLTGAHPDHIQAYRALLTVDTPAGEAGTDDMDIDHRTSSSNTGRYTGPMVPRPPDETTYDSRPVKTVTISPSSGEITDTTTVTTDPVTGATVTDTTSHDRVELGFPPDETDIVLHQLESSGLVTETAPGIYALNTALDDQLTGLLTAAQDDAIDRLDSPMHRQVLEGLRGGPGRVGDLTKASGFPSTYSRDVSEVLDDLADVGLTTKLDVGRYGLAPGVVLPTPEVLANGTLFDMIISGEDDAGVVVQTLRATGGTLDHDGIRQLLGHTGPTGPITLSTKQNTGLESNAATLTEMLLHRHQAGQPTPTVRIIARGDKGSPYAAAHAALVRDTLTTLITHKLNESQLDIPFGQWVPDDALNLSVHTTHHGNPGQVDILIEDHHTVRPTTTGPASTARDTAATFDTDDTEVLEAQRLTRLPPVAANLARDAIANRRQGIAPPTVEIITHRETKHADTATQHAARIEQDLREQLSAHLHTLHQPGTPDISPHDLTITHIVQPALHNNIQLRVITPPATPPDASSTPTDTVTPDEPQGKDLSAGAENRSQTNDSRMNGSQDSTKTPNFPHSVNADAGVGVDPVMSARLRSVHGGLLASGTALDVGSVRAVLDGLDLVVRQRLLEKAAGVVQSHFHDMPETRAGGVDPVLAEVHVRVAYELAGGLGGTPRPGVDPVVVRSANDLAAAFTDALGKGPGTGLGSVRLNVDNDQSSPAPSVDEVATGLQDIHNAGSESGDTIPNPTSEIRRTRHPASSRRQFNFKSPHGRLTQLTTPQLGNAPITDAMRGIETSRDTVAGTTDTKLPRMGAGPAPVEQNPPAATSAPTAPAAEHGDGARPDLVFDFATGDATLTPQHKLALGTTAVELADTLTQRARTGHLDPVVTITGSPAQTTAIQQHLTQLLRRAGHTLAPRIVPGGQAGVSIDWTLRRPAGTPAATDPGRTGIPAPVTTVITSPQPQGKHPVLDDESWRHSPATPADTDWAIHPHPVSTADIDAARVHAPATLHVSEASGLTDNSIITTSKDGTRPRLDFTHWRGPIAFETRRLLFPGQDGNPDTIVQDRTFRIHLDGTQNFTAEQITTFQNTARQGITEVWNNNYRLPYGDQLHYTLEFTTDPALATGHITIAPPGTPPNQLTIPINAEPHVFAHEIGGHYGGLNDQYLENKHDNPSIFTHTTGTTVTHTDGTTSTIGTGNLAPTPDDPGIMGPHAATTTAHVMTRDLWRLGHTGPNPHTINPITVTTATGTPTTPAGTITPTASAATMPGRFQSTGKTPHIPGNSAPLWGYGESQWDIHVVDATTTPRAHVVAMEIEATPGGRPALTAGTTAMLGAAGQAVYDAVAHVVGTASGPGTTPAVISGALTGHGVQAVVPALVPVPVRDGRGQADPRGLQNTYWGIIHAAEQTGQPTVEIPLLGLNSGWTPQESADALRPVLHHHTTRADSGITTVILTVPAAARTSKQAVAARLNDTATTPPPTPAPPPPPPPAPDTPSTFLPGRTVPVTGAADYHGRHEITIDAVRYQVPATVVDFDDETDTGSTVLRTAPGSGLVVFSHPSDQKHAVIRYDTDRTGPADDDRHNPPAQGDRGPSRTQQYLHGVPQTGLATVTTGQVNLNGTTLTPAWFTTPGDGTGLQFQRTGNRVYLFGLNGVPLGTADLRPSPTQPAPRPDRDTTRLIQLTTPVPTGQPTATTPDQIRTALNTIAGHSGTTHTIPTPTGQILIPVNGVWFALPATTGLHNPTTNQISYTLSRDTRTITFTRRHHHRPQPHHPHRPQHTTPHHHTRPHHHHHHQQCQRHEPHLRRASPSPSKTSPSPHPSSSDDRKDADLGGDSQPQVTEGKDQRRSAPAGHHARTPRISPGHLRQYRAKIKLCWCGSHCRSPMTR